MQALAAEEHRPLINKNSPAAMGLAKTVPKVWRSSGRFCQPVMSSSTASVIRLMVSRLMSVPYSSAR